MIHVDSPFQSPAVLSLCTGMRGLERGIERAIGSINTVAYVEIEAFIIENLVRQMEQGVLAPAPVWSNLKTFPGKQFHGKIHGITGGYPCQPFSNAGKRKGKQDPRHLWPYIGGGTDSIVGTIRPFWCYFENVPGHLELGYREVKSNLESLGYTVEEGIFSASEVGAPHQRKRLFILAVDYTSINEQQQEYQISARRNRIEYAGETALANFPGIGQQGQPINQGNIGEENEENLAHPYVRREQQRNPAGMGRLQEPTPWPAGPGKHQHEWEPQRTIESRLGYVLNGYSYREDLLRMAGNGVVEQTAELAWITLWDKIKKGHRFR